MNSQKPSLYIQTENQQLLWDMLHKTPQLAQYFPQNEPGSQEKKETWFRGVISDFHKKTPVVQNRDQLLAMNRQTLSYMMNQLSALLNIPQQKPQPQQQQQQQQQQPHPQQPQQQQRQMPTQNIDSVGTTYSRNNHIENREELYKRQFEEREREYKAMSAPPELPKVEFALSEDTAISNMTELVEQQRRMRELDIQPLIPQPQLQSIDSSSPNMKLKLQEDLPTETIRLDAISLDAIIPVGKRENIKRQVTWNDDHLIEISSQDMTVIQREIHEMKTSIQEFKHVLFQFIEKVDSKNEKREPIENILENILENNENMYII